MAVDLPAEIWHKIYVQLEPKHVKKCALICKQWYVIAQFYMNNSLRVHLVGSNFEKLAHNITECPTLKYRIRDLVFHRRLDDAAQRVLFKTILDNSPKVRMITFCDLIDPTALKLLCNANTRMLPSLEEIRGLNWSKYYCMINFRFRNTITYLCLENLGEDKILSEQFGDLIGFTSQFPHLKTLHAEWNIRTSTKHPIDLNKLLLANKQLEDLVLDNACVKKRYTMNDIKRKTYPPLKRLTIRSKSMDITVLQHILPQLNRLEKLSLHVRNIIPDRSLSKMVAGHIIHHVCKDLDVKHKIVDCRYKKIIYSSFSPEHKFIM